MPHTLIRSGSPYEDSIGFSRAVRVGERVLVSGTAPIWPDGSCPADAYQQARRALEIIVAALADAGAVPADVVRTRMYLVDASDAATVGRAHGEVFGVARPAATMVVVAGLLDPRWRVEMEAEAMIGSEADRLVAAAATRSATAADLEALEALCRRAPDEVSAVLGDDDDRASYLVYGRGSLASESGARLLATLVGAGVPSVFRALAIPGCFGLIAGHAAHMKQLGDALELAGRSEVLMPGIEQSARLAFETMVGARDRDLGLHSLDAHIDGLVAELRPVPPSLRPRLARIVGGAAEQVASAGRHVVDVEDMRDQVLRALQQEG